MVAEDQLERCAARDIPAPTEQSVDGVSDVVDAAWVAAGRPMLEAAGVLTEADGPCARCARGGPLAPVRQVVSRSFTAASDWVHPTGAGLCARCTWAYREPALRRCPHHLTRSPARSRPLAADQLLEVLAHPLRPDETITVPQGGRKHLLPSASWGRIALDDAQIPWGSADAARLQTVAALRAAGTGEADLRQPTPPWPLLRRHPAGSRADLIATWSTLDPWRTRTLWLDLALIATRQATQRRTGGTMPQHRR